MIADLSRVPDGIAEKDVLGVVVVGSSARGYTDQFSDRDLEVIVEDDAYRGIDLGLRIQRIDNDEMLLVPKSDWLSKANSSRDIDHWPYERCKILHDPVGLIERELPQIVQMPPSIRDSRVQLHLFEFEFECVRMPTLLARGDELNCRSSASFVVHALTSTLFVAAHRWPPSPHWLTEELESLSSSPHPWKDWCLSLLQLPSKDLCTVMRRALIEHLAGEGVSDLATRSCMVSGYDFRKARERWGRL